MGYQLPRLFERWWNCLDCVDLPSRAISPYQVENLAGLGRVVLVDASH